MPLLGIRQPDIIQIDEQLRLRKYDGICEFALEWYQDEETVYFLDGVRKKYDLQLLNDMYEYLNNRGETYFIEILSDATYTPIGDVTFEQYDMPIVIGNKNYRNQGIGKKVVSALITRGKELGFADLWVRDIFDYNEASIKCFESVGFLPIEKTDKGHKYVLRLK